MSSDMYSEIIRAAGVTENMVISAFARQRMVPLHGKIDADKADGIAKTMIAFDLKEVAPIKLIISSKGGDVTAGEAIIDAIRSLNSPVEGIVVGHAASMAIDVLFACNRRTGLPHSRYFLHFQRKGFDIVCDDEVSKKSSITAVMNKIREGKARQEKCYAERMKKPVGEIRRLLRLGEALHAEYSADDAVKLNIIDEISRNFKYFPLPKEGGAQKSK